MHSSRLLPRSPCAKLAYGSSAPAGRVCLYVVAVGIVRASANLLISFFIASLGAKVLHMRSVEIAAKYHVDLVKF